MGDNLGVRVGKWSVLEPECGLVILDVDLREPLGADACYGAVERLLGHSELNVASGRGLGGHVYMKCPLATLPGKAATTVAQGEGWKLELFSTGKQVVVPPSVHPDTGEVLHLGQCRDRRGIRVSTQTRGGSRKLLPGTKTKQLASLCS